VRPIRAIEVLGVALAFAAYAGYVFQVASGAPFHAGIGDWFDPYFINFLLEHWYHSLTTFTDPTSPPMFFPARDTLGYSHGLVLYAPFYALVRPFLEPFLAESAALFLVIVTGAVCLYVVLRRYFGLRLMEAVALSAFFVTSPNITNEVMGQWIQRASVFFIPMIAWLGFAARDRQGWRGALLAWLAGFGALLMFTQDFYTGILSALVAALLLTGAPSFLKAVLTKARNARRVLGAAARAWRGVPAPEPRASVWWIVAAGVLAAWGALIAVHPLARQTVGGLVISARRPTTPLALATLAAAWFLCRRGALGARIGAARASAGPGSRAPWRALAAMVGTAMGAALFVLIYLGPYREHTAFPVDQLIQQLKPLDSGIWRTPWELMTSARPYPSLRPFLLVMMAGLAMAIPAFKIDRASRLYGLWLIAVAALVFLIPYSFGGTSIWRALLAPLPGLSAIRDPKRIIEPFELGVTLAVAYVVTRLPVHSAWRRSAIVSTALVIALTWNTSRLRFDRQIEAFRAAVEAPLAIDPSCRSFFVKSASEAYMSRSGHKQILYGMDSAFIALNHGIPTLNGYSAWAPPDWGWGLANPQEEPYAHAVNEWIDHWHLGGVCILDIEARTMAPYSVAVGR
jgi:hypothetical protein